MEHASLDSVDVEVRRGVSDDALTVGLERVLELLERLG